MSKKKVRLVVLGVLTVANVRIAKEEVNNDKKCR